jgi:hypothetical protein
MIALKRYHDIWFYIAIFVLLAIEYMWFRTYVLHEIAYYYPYNFDQASYLRASYVLYHDVKVRGLHSIWQYYPIGATGLLFPLQTLLFFLLFGTSRLTALSISFFYFALLLCVCILVVKRFSRKLYVPIIFLALLLSIQTPFLPFGGVTDFRIDFIAFCLYGIFITCVIRSQIFLERKWTIIAALLGCILILFRYITAVYIGLNFFLMFLYLCCNKYWQYTDIARLQSNKRIINLLIAGSIIGLFAFIPCLMLSGHAIYNYYVVGHVLGGEKYIRSILVGSNGLFASLTFYPRLIIFRHLGINLVAICLRLLAIGFLLFILAKVFNNKREPRKKHVIVNNNILSSNFAIGCVFLVLSIILPLIILTLDVSKSFVVGGIVVMPILWLVMWIFLRLDEKRTVITNRIDWINYIIAIVLLIIGVYSQYHGYHRSQSAARLQDLQSISKMYNDIGNYTVAKKIPVIYLSVDSIKDSLSAGNLVVLYFEKYGKLLNVEQPMWKTLFPVDKQQVIRALQKSNVVIVNLSGYRGITNYPFDNSIRNMREFMMQYVKRHFVKFGDYKFDGYVYRVYV